VRGACLLLVAALLAAPSASAAAGGVWAALGASPELVQAAAQSGGEAALEWAVRNLGGAPATVEWELEDMGRDGAPRPPGSTEWTLAGRVRLPAPVRLGPGEAAHVVAWVTGVDRARMGIALGRLAEGGAAVGVRLVAVPRGARPALSGEVLVGPSGRVAVRLRNGGQAASVVRGSVFLLRGGEFYGRLDVPRAVVLPGGEALIDLAWPEVLPEGVAARVVLYDDLSGGPPIVLP
jgi:hypothetical protein